MSVVIEAPQTQVVSQHIFNDFNINVATANGSGSQTSNNMLFRSLYKMGIPVTGGNVSLYNSSGTVKGQPDSSINPTPVVGVLGMGLFRSQPLQPGFEIGVQPALVVVDENAGGDMHRVDENEALLDSALAKTLLDLGRDVDEGAAARRLEPQFLAPGLHPNPPFQDVVSSRLIAVIAPKLLCAMRSRACSNCSLATSM